MTQRDGTGPSPRRTLRERNSDRWWNKNIIKKANMKRKGEAGDRCPKQWKSIYVMKEGLRKVNKRLVNMTSKHRWSRGAEDIKKWEWICEKSICFSDARKKSWIAEVRGGLFDVRDRSTPTFALYGLPGMILTCILIPWPSTTRFMDDSWFLKEQLSPAHEEGKEQLLSTYVLIGKISLQFHVWQNRYDERI